MLCSVTGFRYTSFLQSFTVLTCTHFHPFWSIATRLECSWCDKARNSRIFLLATAESDRFPEKEVSSWAITMVYATHDSGCGKDLTREKTVDEQGAMAMRDSQGNEEHLTTQ